LKSLLLDTNAYSRLRLGDESVLRALESVARVYFSIFVVAELLYGFAGGRREAANKKLLGEFLKLPSVKLLQTSEQTARYYGRIKNDLKKKGTPIPINDIWIAAHAIEYETRLLSFDKHFEHITSLRRWPE
jgi:tRNA(fMet)-specific endonuclease VapC